MLRQMTLIIGLMALSCVALAAQAQDSAEQTGRNSVLKALVEQQEIDTGLPHDHARSLPVNVSRKQASQQAQEEYGGRVLSTFLNRHEREPYYQVRLIEGGQIRVVRIAAHQ